jgi:hypothetical protein
LSHLDPVPIPECDACAYRQWPATCANAAEGVARKCELIHALGRRDYAAGLDRAMCGVPEPDPASLNPGATPRPCCGQPDPAAFFGA